MTRDRFYGFTVLRFYGFTGLLGIWFIPISPPRHQTLFLTIRVGKTYGETPWRVTRTDGLAFTQDPIFTEIRNTLDHLAVALGSKNKFINPLLGNIAETLKAESIATSHPLGGCAIGKNAAEGVVDEFGRVFANTGTDVTPEYYDGLYIADASIFPTALGVNPSLTISALALRIDKNIANEMDA